MNKQIKIYKERLQAERKYQELEDQLESMKDTLDTIKNECQHRVILTFGDHRHHKVNKLVNYYCPACGKSGYLYPEITIMKKYFKKSKIVDLSDIELETSFSAISEHIFSNYSYYYDNDTSCEEISESMREFINTKKVNDAKYLSKKFKR